MKKALIVVFLLPGVLFCQTLPDDVQQSIKKRIEFGYTPSVAVGIIDKHGTHYYNFGSKTKNGAAVDEHTIYEIGSISKVFTAILLAQQVVDAKVKLDDPAQKYLPADVVMPKTASAEILLGNLSDHTSGLPRMPSNFTPKDPANPYADYTVEQMYSFLSNYTLPRDIGSQYEYSNLAQGLLGHLLARNAETSYEQLMIDVIAKPLGMNETKVVFDDRMKKNLALGYSDGRQVSNWDLPTFAGAGGIRSSTSDMLKFLSANLGYTKTKLRQAMDLTYRARHDKAGKNRVGLGWHIAFGKNGDVIWHNGGTGGYRTFAGFVKETGVGVVVLTNSTAGADDIGFHLLNPDSPLRTVKPSATSKLREAIDAKGNEEGVSFYKQILSDQKDAYEFSEDEMNTLGYYYLNDVKNTKAALAVFKLNVDQFPNSSNVYDSYGEALAADGQKELAIENYKKSVELNPGNQSGINALERLGVKVANEVPDVPDEVLLKYVGVYELMPGFNIEISKSGKQLFEQATGQARFEIYSKNATEFYLRVVTAQIIFNVKDDVVESLTLVQNGRSITGKKIK